MIDKKVYTKEYIDELKIKYHTDPQIIERTIFAFGLLETLVISNVDFIFKGGTSLMLLLDKPYRLSTDIDIVVKPNIDIVEGINKASSVFPFIRYEEDIRIGKNNITKKHYRFFYKSLRDSTKEVPILLDVLFEDNHYSKIIKKEIKNELLITTSNPILVKLPSVDSLSGDKLTAFAPKTIGVIPLQENRNGLIIDKRIEVIKQFYDIASLFDSMSLYNDVFDSYFNIAKTEINYRGLNVTYKECLIDTYVAATCICSKGRLYKNDYNNYLYGIKGINNYLINTNFNGERAYIQASKVMYLCACLLSNTYSYELKEDYELLKGEFSKLNYIKKIDKERFRYIVAAIEIMEMNKEIQDSLKIYIELCKEKNITK